MSLSPLVSIILPTYNRAELIMRAVESVLTQTFEDFELIIVDDASTDNTLKLLQNLEDDRIRIFPNQINTGASLARNIGIKEARGSFIAFQDSDDVWVASKLKDQIDCFKKHPNAGIVYSSYKKITPSQSFLVPGPWVKKHEGNLKKELSYGNFIGLPTMIVKKECLSAVGVFDESLKSLEDWDLLLRLSTLYSFAYIDTPLVFAYESSNGVNTFTAAALSSLRRIISKYELFQVDNKAKAHTYYLEGSMLIHMNQIKQGRSLIFTAFSLDKTNSKYALSLFCSLFGSKNYVKLLNIIRAIYTKT